MIEPVFGRGDKLTRLEVPGKQISPLVPVRLFQTSPGESGRGQVQHADKVVADSLLRDELFRPHHDKGNVQSAFRRHLFVSDEVIGSMVGKVDDDRVLLQTGLIESLEYPPDVIIVGSNGVIVLRHRLSVDLIVRVVGRHSDVCRISLSRSGELLCGAFSATCLHLHKERLVGL